MAKLNERIGALSQGEQDLLVQLSGIEAALSSIEKERAKPSLTTNLFEWLNKKEEFGKRQATKMVELHGKNSTTKLAVINTILKFFEKTKDADWSKRYCKKLLEREGF